MCAKQAYKDRKKQRGQNPVGAQPLSEFGASLAQDFSFAIVV
jgi:hypothetical protein